MIQPLCFETIVNKIVVIGFFDVVHKGHKQLIEYAKRLGNVSVLTFRSIPRKDPINDLNQRADNLKELGIQDIILFDIDKNNMTASEFIERYLVHAKGIIVGNDFILGSDMKSIAEFKDKLKLHLVQYDQRYSTTKIKKALLSGNVELANEILITPFNVSSIVVEGNKLGRQIGFATANFNFNKELKLMHGVYLTKTFQNNKWYKSVSIYGKPNTIKTTNVPIMETHILNFDKDIYGDKIKVQFHKRIADLKKYNSKEELVNAITEFVNIAKTMKY